MSNEQHFTDIIFYMIGGHQWNFPTGDGDMYFGELDGNFSLSGFNEVFNAIYDNIRNLGEKNGR